LPGADEEAPRWGAKDQEKSFSCGPSNGVDDVVKVERQKAYLGEGKGCKSVSLPLRKKKKNLGNVKARMYWDAGASMRQSGSLEGSCCKAKMASGAQQAIGADKVHDKKILVSRVMVLGEIEARGAWGSRSLNSRGDAQLLHV
jgi:hypothetical protein